MKTKVGTVLDEDILYQLKIRAAKEKRSMSDIIQDALKSYFHNGALEKAERQAAVRRLCSKPFNLSLREIQELMEEDYYDQ